MTSQPSPSPQEPCALVNWLELPGDVSASIIRRLHVVEILTSVQYVCSTWRRICRDPSMWTSISCVNYAGQSKVHLDLCKLYRFAVDLSSGGLLDVYLDYYYANVLLRYISVRSKQLRRISLGYWRSCSEVEFIEVVEKFPTLEELDISKCGFSSEVLASVGRLCPRLYSLKCNLFSDGEAFAVANNMPGLCHLHLVGDSFTNFGLIAILDGCQHLEPLDVSGCFIVSFGDDLRRYSERIKDFRDDLVLLV